MHSDVEALDALRRAKNKIQRMMHIITRITIELYYVKALLKVWREHARIYTISDH